MEATIVKIGNSKGLRLSKTILEKYNITNKVELTLGDNEIILKPIVKPRQGWADQFKKMNEEGDDALLMPDIFEDEEFDPF